MHGLSDEGTEIEYSPDYCVVDDMIYIMYFDKHVLTFSQFFGKIG